MSKWWFVKISLSRHHTLMVANCVFNNKIYYVPILWEIINPKGHPNHITGWKSTAILLNGWILPISGASSGRVCACRLRSRLVFICTPWISFPTCWIFKNQIHEQTFSLKDKWCHFLTVSSTISRHDTITKTIRYSMQNSILPRTLVWKHNGWWLLTWIQMHSSK